MPDFLAPLRPYLWLAYVVVGLGVLGGIGYAFKATYDAGYEARTAEYEAARTSGLEAMIERMNNATAAANAVRDLSDSQFDRMWCETHFPTQTDDCLQNLAIERGKGDCAPVGGYPRPSSRPGDQPEEPIFRGIY